MRVPFSSLPLFLLLAACSGDDKEETDVDGDGVEAPADCDDNDPQVKPGAVEVCDGIDNDCDGEIDEGSGDLYYVDADGDGFGDDALPRVFLCAIEAGYVVGGGDCDDNDAGVNPDEAEQCDAVDRNCDGSTTVGAADVTEWYIDRDADGYGAPPEYGGLPAVSACEAPAANYVANGEDCNDAAASANPMGTETCNGIDDDCNGAVDDDPSDGTNLFVDYDLDGYGDVNSPVFGCPALGLSDNEDDCDDSDALINPDAYDLCNGGIDDDCDPTTSEDDLFGAVWYVDGDNDGVGDAEVRSCEQPVGTSDEGGDCDDGDDTVLPGAPEDCTATDRNCDGDPVAGASDSTVYYADADGDLFGNPATATASCVPIAGFVEQAGDCNDANNLINPDAEELCNGGVDDDCSPATTDDDAPTAPSWYFDSDGDGFAGSDSEVIACEAPPYGFSTADDCNDLDPYIYPGANDVCDGGIDNDCDPLTDENLISRLYEDADYDGFGNNSVFELGCQPSGALTNAIPVGDDCDDTDPLVNPIDTPDCSVEHCGTLSTSETWRANVQHRVTCDVVVEGANGPTLTILPGTQVLFDANTELRVGDDDSGSLFIDAPTPVVFTSGEAVPANGDWDGVLIGAEQDGSYIRGLTIEYAGGAGGADSAGLRLDLGNTDMEVSELTASRNAGDGVRVITGEPLIHDSILTDNDRNGLYVRANQGLSRLDAGGTEGPSFTGNIVTGNGDRPVTVPGSHADEIGPSTPAPFVGDNVFVDPANPNGVESIGLLTGTMRTTGTWRQHNIPYYVAADVTITVQDGPEAVLTIDDGVLVYFDEDAEIVIGDTAQGALIIGDYPNPSAPGDVVEFLADPALSADNLNWGGVQIGPNGSDSLIAGLLVEEGGSNGRGNLWVEGSAPAITHSVFRNSDSAGIYVEGSAAAPRITSTDMVDNDTYGLFVASNSGIARDVLGASFINNSFLGNGTTSAVLPPNFVAQLDASSSFSDPDPLKRIRMHGGTVSDDGTWQKLDADYEVLGTVVVEGPRDPVLEIEPQTHLYMARDTRFEVGTGEDGSLLIDAGPVLADRVVFTSADPAPGPGDWVGLEIGDNGPLKPQSSLSGLDVYYAGSLGSVDSGAIKLQTRNGGCGPYFAPQREVLLQYIDILFSGNVGLFYDPYAVSSIDNVTIEAPLDGLCIVMDPIIPGGCDVGKITTLNNLNCVGVDLGFLSLGSLTALDPAVDYGNIYLDGGNVEDDTTIPALASPLVVSDSFVVGGPTNPELTIEDGTQLLFAGGEGITVGGFEPGALTVLGDTSQFLPLDGSRWEGFRLRAQSSVLIEGGYFESGGGNGEGTIWIDGSTDVVLEAGTTFSNSFGTCDVALELISPPVYPPYAPANFPVGVVVDPSIYGGICPL